MRWFSFYIERIPAAALLRPPWRKAVVEEVVGALGDIYMLLAKVFSTQFTYRYLEHGETILLLKNYYSMKCSLLLTI